MIKRKDFAAAAAVADQLWLKKWGGILNLFGSREHDLVLWARKISHFPRKFPKISVQFLLKISINFCLHIFVVKYYTWSVLPGDIPGDQIWTSYICTSRLLTVIVCHTCVRTDRQDQNYKAIALRVLKHTKKFLLLGRTLPTGSFNVWV